MRTFLATALAVLAVPAVRADEAYTIKLKLDVDTGLTATYRSKSNTSKEFKGSFAGQKEFGGTTKSEEETIYKETVLNRDGSGKPTAYVRVYEKATKIQNGNVEAVSYHGRTVLFEKVGDRFRVGVTGEAPLDPKDVSKLLKDANRKSDPHAIERGLAPGRPVKVGDSWSMPIKPVAQYFDFIVADESKSSALGKLLKVYSKGSETFGTFEVTIKLAFTAMYEEGQELVSFDPPGILDISQHFDLAIDGGTPEGSDTGSMAIKGDGKWLLAGKEARVASTLQVEASSQLSSVTDDPTARVRPKVTFAADPDEWVEVKPKDGSFTVRFPAIPTAITSKGKKATTTRWTIGTRQGTRVYVAVLTEFDDPASVNPAALQKAVLASSKGARDVKEIKVGEFNGIEFKFDQEQSGGTYEFIRRVIITKQRGFELRVGAPKGNASEAEKFFNSFEILVKPKDK
jgi:hypothetical protein